MTETGAPIDPGTAWTPSATEPTTAAGAVIRPAGSANRTRWIVAGLVLVIVAGLAIAAGILLTGRATPEALGYLPADSAIVAEIRMDLPGDQLQKVGNLLAHFPGFKDQSTLPQKLDESFTKIVTSASKGEVDYAKQIKPWIAGPVYMAAFVGLPASEPPTISPEASMPTFPVSGGFSSPGVIVATTDGTATCESLFPAGKAPTSSTYQGVTILADGGAEACALNGRIGIIGPAGLVRAALDAHADQEGLDTSSAYRAAREILSGDRLATFYLSKAFVTAAMNQGTGPVPLPTGQLHAALAALPDWFMYGVSAEDDALVADFVSAPFTAPAPTAGATALPTAPPAHVSKTATLVPANALALIDVHGAGITIENVLATLKDDPTVGQSLGQLDTTLGALGGAGALVGWIDDAGIAVVPDGTGASGGVLLLAADDATAAAKITQLKSLISLAGLSGTQVQVHDETVNGTTMTVVDLGDLSALLQSVGGASAPVPAGTHVTVAFAAKGSAVVAGGDAFVRAVLGMGAGGSLADAAGYKHALGRAAAENLGEIYIGTGSLLALADAALPAADRGSFDTDTKPYLEPFDAILMTTTLEKGGAHARIVATVK